MEPMRIGWKESIDFLDWGIRRVKVKIDTGARTSALDVQRCTLHRTPEGLIAELELALSRKHPERVITVSTPVVRMVTVRNTGGNLEERPVIETTIRLGPVVKTVQLTVANRRAMSVPVILGRRALDGDFIVDVSRKYLAKAFWRVSDGNVR